MRKTTMSFAVLLTTFAISGWSANFDCKNPSQRLSCSEPSDPDKHFVCQTTGSKKYVKVSVSRNSRGHDNDPAPGASANDIASAIGLDCDCQPRVCDDVCTGAVDGASCDDADRCTFDGVCTAGVCQPGEPVCHAGTPVDPTDL